MRKNEFDLLVDELVACKRERDAQMAKAMRVPKITRYDEADIRGMFRLAKAMQVRAERERLEQRRAQQARAAEARRQRFTETLAKAHTVLRSDVLAGRMTALETAKAEAALHRFAGCL